MKRITNRLFTKTIIGVLLSISLTSFASYASETATAEETTDEKIERLTKEIEETMSIGPAAEITLNEKKAELTELTAVPEEATVFSEEVQPAPVGNRWGVTLSEEEFEIMAHIGQLECGGESDIGQQAVFEVILNRVADPSYPNNTTAVLSQRTGRYQQFTTWKNVNSGKATPSEGIKNNLRIVLNGGSNILPMNTVYFSRGAQNNRVQARIGRHVFCNK